MKVKFTKKFKNTLRENVRFNGLILPPDEITVLLYKCDEYDGSLDYLYKKPLDYYVYYMHLEINLSDADLHLLIKYPQYLEKVEF